jgi:NAD-dependent deacetylase
MENNMIQKCADLINTARSIVVLTGAGISTESGIKDFRSRTGLYKMAPEYILSLGYFMENPKEFYQFAVENLYHPDAKPNKGHEVLAEWEAAGRVKHVITQNIDALHQKAGSKHVIEFHGTIKTASCLNCGRTYSTEEMVARMDTMEDFYVCSYCTTPNEGDHYIKPDVVLFGDTGDWFTVEGFDSIRNMINQADCVLVVGTSLNVTPFSFFPSYRRQGVPLIIINRGGTPYDLDQETYVIQESIGETLRRIDKRILGIAK